MAEAIVDGTGTIGEYAKVGSDNRLWVRTEGITVGSLSVNAGSVSYIPAGSVIITNTVDVLGSVNVDNASSIGSLGLQNVIGSVRQLTDPWIVLGSVHQVNSPSVTTGSESWIKGGSLAPFSGTNYIDVTQTTNPWIVLGSVNIDNSSDVGGYAGSDVYIPGGSVVVEGTVSVLGSTHVTQSTSPWVISGEVTTDNYLGSNAYIPAGSVIITNSPSVDIGNTGSVQATINSPASIGSYTTQGVTFSSGTGYIDVTQTTNPWIVLGSINVDNASAVGGFAGSETFIPAGSVIITNSPSVDIGNTGSVQAIIGAPTSIGSFTTQTVDGTVSVTGIATAGSLATQGIIGSVEVTNGSLNVYGAFSATTGSQSYLFGKSGADYYPLLVGSDADGGILRTSASVDVSTGSEVWIRGGSVQPYSQIGSVEVWQGTASDLAVDIGNIGSVRAILDNPVGVGSYTTQGVTFSSGTGYIDVTQTTSPWIVQGSVNIDNFASIGSFTTQTVDGTVSVTNIATAGSLAIQTVDGTIGISSPETIGSYTTQGVTFSSGTNYMDVTQTTNPWVISGNVLVSGTVMVSDLATAGSLATQGVTFSSGTGYIDVTQTTSPWIVLGSVNAVIDDPVAIGSYTTQGVTFSSGTSYIDVTQTTSPWVIAGSVNAVIDDFVAVGSLATQTVDGTVSVTDIGIAGSLAIQTVSGLNAWNAIGSVSLSSIKVNAASGTSVNIVTGVAASNINVYAYKLVCGSTLSLSWLDELTAMEGSQFYAANGGVVESVSPPSYLFRTGTGSALKLATTGNVAGRVSYFIT